MNTKSFFTKDRCKFKGSVDNSWYWNDEAFKAPTTKQATIIILVIATCFFVLFLVNYFGG